MKIIGYSYKLIKTLLVPCFPVPFQLELAKQWIFLICFHGNNFLHVSWCLFCDIKGPCGKILENNKVKSFKMSRQNPTK